MALGLELAGHVDRPGVVVSPVGRFALERLRRRGFEEPERYEPEFWDRVTRLAAESGALWKGCGFDTVIVDEGQDFGKHEWAIVMRYAVRMNIAVSRAFGALRVVAGRHEVERDPILRGIDKK